eukprot:1282733-Rhodomonas_salina.1
MRATSCFLSCVCFLCVRLFSLRLISSRVPKQTLRRHASLRLATQQILQSAAADIDAIHPASVDCNVCSERASVNSPRGPHATFPHSNTGPHVGAVYNQYGGYRGYTTRYEEDGGKSGCVHTRGSRASGLAAPPPSAEGPKSGWRKERRRERRRDGEGRVVSFPGQRQEDGREEEGREEAAESLMRKYTVRTPEAKREESEEEEEQSEEEPQLEQEEQEEQERREQGLGEDESVRGTVELVGAAVESERGREREEGEEELAWKGREESLREPETAELLVPDK